MFPVFEQQSTRWKSRYFDALTFVLTSPDAKGLLNQRESSGFPLVTEIE